MNLTVTRLKSIFDHLEEVLMAALLAFMTCITFIQVILRYVFDAGWVWSLEATTYSFAWLVLIGMSYGVRTQTHIAVDFVVNMLPARIRFFVVLFTLVLCISYAGLMLYGSAMFIQGLYTIGSLARDIPVPKWLLTIVMPLAFMMLGVRFFQAVWHVFKDRK